MQCSQRTELDRHCRRAHAQYAHGWIESKLHLHWDEPLVAATAVGVIDLYADWVAANHRHPVGYLPDLVVDAPEVEAKLRSMAASRRLVVGPGVIMWDRPWPLRTGRAARASRRDGPDMVWWFIGLGVPA
jgi:hypothetical protein